MENNTADVTQEPFQRIASRIKLKATSFLKFDDFLKELRNIGWTIKASPGFFGSFCNIDNSPSKEAASYLLVQEIREKELYKEAKSKKIYGVFDLAHVDQLCELHFIQGRKIFEANNLLIVKNKHDQPCLIQISFDEKKKICLITVLETNPDCLWSMGVVLLGKPKVEK